MKRLWLYKNESFSINNKNKIEIELDSSNYATKSDLKSATGVNTSQFAKKRWFS